MPSPTSYTDVVKPEVVPVVMQEPTTGGNYLRDPTTGTLTPNPAFQENLE